MTLLKIPINSSYYFTLILACNDHLEGMERTQVESSVDVLWERTDGGRGKVATKCQHVGHLVVEPFCLREVYQGRPVTKILLYGHSLFLMYCLAISSTLSDTDLASALSFGRGMV